MDQDLEIIPLTQQQETIAALSAAIVLVVNGSPVVVLRPMPRWFMRMTVKCSRSGVRKRSPQVAA